MRKKKFTHTLDDDIESLFYTFLYVACDGVLKWKKGLGSMDLVVAMKFKQYIEILVNN